MSTGVRRPSLMGTKFRKSIAKGSTTSVEVDVILDSCIVGEIYSIGDLLREAEKPGFNEASLDSPTFNYRRQRVRHSIVLAWWLAKHGRVAANFGLEAMDLLQHRLSREEDAASFAFTAAYLHIVKPFVLNGWGVQAFTSVNHDAEGTDVDTQLLDIAARDRIPLITHEGFTEEGFNISDLKKLRNRCLSAGVTVYTSQEYLAAQEVNVHAECEQFLRGLAVAVQIARERRILYGKDVVDALEPIYSSILKDSRPPDLPHGQSIRFRGRDA